MAALSASLALADDFKTVNGKEYKNAAVTRVEPDGIVIKFHGGIVKLQFAELPADVQKKYGYDPVAAKRYEASLQEAAIPRATPTPDAGIHNADDAFNAGWKHGYETGYHAAQISIVSGNRFSNLD